MATNGPCDPTSTPSLWNAFSASPQIAIDFMLIDFDSPTALNETTLLREYRRLAGFLNAEFSSFERKHFMNLSHAANKAMNLNGYLALMGKSWKVSCRGNNAYLEPTAEERADLSPPRVEVRVDPRCGQHPSQRLYSSVDRSDGGPGNERLAIAQTPYSAFPGARDLLERTAGATTDIQYLIHQGFTQFQGTYWVGANALIRRRALNYVAVRQTERGFQ